jgi:predicted Rdx family selenoprotein
VSHRIEIEFSTPEQRSEALDLAADVLAQWAHEIAAVTLVPTRGGGSLNVILDGERIYSITADDQPAERAQINSEIEARLGPPPGEGA